MRAIIRIIDHDGRAIEHPTPAISKAALREITDALRAEYARRWGRAVYGYAVYQ